MYHYQHHDSLRDLGRSFNSMASRPLRGIMASLIGGSFQSTVGLNYRYSGVDCKGYALMVAAC